MTEIRKREKLFYKTQQPPQKSNAKPAKFQDFVKYGNLFYRTVGIEPYQDRDKDTKSNAIVANLIFYVQIINMNVVMSTEVVFVVMAFSNGSNFIEATYAMSYIGFAMAANIKMIFVSQQKTTLTKFVNGLKDIFPQHQFLQNEYNLPKHLKHCSFVTLSFSCLYMILIWTYNMMGIVKYLVCDVLLGMPDIDQDLPFIVYSPWNWKHHWSYYLLYAMHDMAGFTAAAGQISNDLFLIACTSQLIMYFDYLAKKITDFSCSDCLAEDIEFLKVSIRYHANLLHSTEQLNQVFGVPLLLNFCSSAFIICFVGFQLTNGASPETMIKLTLFFISSTSQVFLICRFGQQLIDASTSVASAVYNQNWFWSDLRFQKMLILMAQRAQTPAQIKATTFVRISLNTFSELMQISYKFFALLKTMFED